MKDSLIPIFIGYDYRERAAANVLIDSLYQTSTTPLSITPLVTHQLEKRNIFYRKKDPKQSTAFSFTRLIASSAEYDRSSTFKERLAILFEILVMMFWGDIDRNVSPCILLVEGFLRKEMKLLRVNH